MRKATTRGFTLLELLLVITIIGLLMTFLLPRGLDIVYKARVTACKANLNNIYGGYILYKDTMNHLPKESGVKNFLSIWDVWEHTEANARRLTCPELDPPDGLLDPNNPKEYRPAEKWFDPVDACDGTFTTYAGRDTKAFPMRSLSGSEPLVADDNDGGANHRAGITLVLYGNGEVKEFVHAKLKKEGVIPEDVDYLEIGPDSPVEDLRKLTRD